MIDIQTTLQIIREFFTGLDIRNLVDVGIVAVLIYFSLIFIRKTKLFFIFNTLVVLWLVIIIARIFDLRLTEALFQPFITFFLLIIIIVFQREIRRFFEWFSLSRKNIPFLKKKQAALSREIVKEIVTAVEELVRDRIGALIVLEGQHPLDQKVFDGVPLNGLISSELLISIFDTNTPGHDGAVIISNNRITQFAVHLPLALNYKNLDKTGTRHRAATGITEISDALAIVVSEERGIVSIALNGTLRKTNKEKFEKVLNKFVESQIKIPTQNTEKFLLELVTKNWIEKISAIIIAATLWATLILY